MRENLPKNDTNSSLDELKKRYEARGADYHASEEYIVQEGGGIPTRTMFSEARDGGLDGYKNGKNGDERYMTDSDFASYYADNRKYTPEPNVDFDSMAALNTIDQKRYGKRVDENVKDKLTENKRREELRKTLERNSSEQKVTKTETGYIIREKRKGVISYKEEVAPTPIKEKAKKARREWIPYEDRKKETMLEGGKTELPKTVILAIITIAFSLLLIVGSTVMLTMAKKEQATLRGDLEGLLYTEKLLREELDTKNSKLDIEDFAEHELGMISREYVDVEYIKSNKNDSLEFGDKESSSEFGISTIIDFVVSLFDRQS